MARSDSKTWQPYAVAVLVTAAGIGLKLLLDRVTSQEQTPFLLLALSVLLSAWYGGAGPGLLSTGILALVVRWIFIEPRYSLAMTNPSQALVMVVFVLEGGLISLLCESRLRALDEARNGRLELEDRVAARTSELANQREFLEALLSSLKEGIVAVDADGKVVLMNRSALDLYGLPAATVPPEEWDRYHQSLYGDGVTPMPPAERPLRRLLRDVPVEDMEKVVITHDGTRRDLLSNGRVILDAQGRKVGAVIAFRDVTDRKRAEEDLRRYAEQLQRSNRELQDFASVASHDLQEPLRKIQAFGGRLKDRFEGALGDDGKDYLARMLNAAGRMSTLINDLLTFSRVTTRAQPFRPTDLAEVARDVVNDLETRIEQSGGRVEVGPLPRIDADPLQIRQLLQNLIGNALKFNRPNTPPVVRVNADLVGAGTEAICRLTIEDNGIGFDEKYLDRIFNVFQRLHGRTEYEGTGIGLAVCRKIAERHHGSITARSSPDQGSMFIVTLPVTQLQHPADAPAPAALSAAAATPVMTTTESTPAHA